MCLSYYMYFVNKIIYQKCALLIKSMHFLVL